MPTDEGAWLWYSGFWRDSEQGAALIEDEEIEPDGLVPRRWSWTAATGATINLVGNLGRAVSCWADDFATLLAQHTAAWYDEQDFVASVHADLESLPET